ncbi:hypothetical protein [Streptomyces sp. NPDC001348]
MSPPDSPLDHSPSTRAARRRDRGLRRVGSTTRWVAAAAAAGSVVLATGYAQTLPGKSAPASRNTSRPSAPVPGPSTTPRASHSAAPHRTAAPPAGKASHPTAHHRRTAPATRQATPAPRKPPAATPKPSHTTSGAS